MKRGKKNKSKIPKNEECGSEKIRRFSKEVMRQEEKSHGEAFKLFSFSPHLSHTHFLFHHSSLPARATFSHFPSSYYYSLPLSATKKEGFIFSRLIMSGERAMFPFLRKVVSRSENMKLSFLEVKELRDEAESSNLSVNFFLLTFRRHSFYTHIQIC